MFGIIKSVSGMLVGIGVSTIVSGAIKAVTPSNLGKIKNFCVSLAAFGIGASIFMKANTEVNGMIDLAEEMVSPKEVKKEEEKKTEEKA